MTYNRELFKSVLLSKEDYEAYMEWSREFQNTYKTRFHKGYLAELLQNGNNCIRDLKTKQQLHTHTISKMQGGKNSGELHIKVIQKINDKWALDKLEDKSTFRVPHIDFKAIIRDVFKKYDNRTLNARRDEILPLLDLEVTQEKGKWYVVHKTYEQQIKEVPLIKVSNKVENKLLFMINKIKNGTDWQGQTGLLKTDVMRGCKDKYEFDCFKEMALAHGIHFDEKTTRYIYKSPEQECDSLLQLAEVTSR